jgi:uncharacterized metal-binding protein
MFAGIYRVGAGLGPAALFFAAMLGFLVFSDWANPSQTTIDKQDGTHLKVAVLLETTDMLRVQIEEPVGDLHGVWLVFRLRCCLVVLPYRRQAMQLIQVLGTGCPKCEKLKKHAEEAVQAAGTEARIEKITDIGQITAFARQLTADGAGKMSCLAGIGGRVSGFLETARASQVLLIIEGCPLHCGRHTLEQAGFKKFEHVCLADLGMAKGKTPATDQAVAKVVKQAAGRFAGYKMEG